MKCTVCYSVGPFVVPAPGRTCGVSHKASAPRRGSKRSEIKSKTLVGVSIAG